MKLTLPVALSFNAGYVDTSGFLALQGLFTAHVTGNFVTFGAAMVHGTSGALTKLLALPVFCVVVIVSRLLGPALAARGLPDLRILMGLKVLLLAMAAALFIGVGPFPNSDAAPAMLAGMLLVAAMAIQNGIHRTHLTDAAPSTLMTGSTTQIMVDITDLMRGVAEPQRQAVHARLKKLAFNVVAFAIGCGIAALVYVLSGMWVFLLPPLVALAAFALPNATPVPAAKP
ncbi:membrane protein [Azorhizobium oxalatiphilum]|uniref:Membrane protein n=1 Tax=Azorhizobium oxalatiphilum TaxID=980631 RepID=A0A917BJU2_9HYPH|nr:YoaK family protein [Azorhizobium oxalatiphilum]GGF47104.1 membrane protein [Azorhizobium oxalatiphilum]